MNRTPNISKKYLFILAVIVGLSLFFIIPNIQKPKPTEIVDQREDKINQFIDEFNQKNPGLSFASATVDRITDWKYVIHNDKNQNIEIIYNNDNKFIITIDTYEDTIELGRTFTAILKMFVAEDGLDGIWSDLISSDHNEIEYKSTKLTYNNSGDMQVSGRSHYKWVKIEGER